MRHKANVDQRKCIINTKYVIKNQDESKEKMRMGDEIKMRELNKFEISHNKYTN